MARLGLLLGACCAVASLRAQPDPFPDVAWELLMNGRDLSGWRLAPYNGAAHFEFRDGAVVGTTVAGERITFLETERMYGDFLLEGEALLPERMNAGVQFRSHSFPEYGEGIYHGYQYELYGSVVEHMHRAVGGIFDEARRGWIGPVVDRAGAENPLRVGDWNEIRILAVGGHIQTWLNGIPVVELHDHLTPAGHIALQLHNSLKRSGDQIRWRNFRIKDLDRSARGGGEEQVAGRWKGATSNAGAGIYAEVELTGDLCLARFYENPELGGPVLAQLSGKMGAGIIVLTGDGWTGTIEHGVLRGQGHGRGAIVVNHTVERTTELVPLSYVMMPGRFGRVTGHPLMRAREGSRKRGRR